MQSPELKKQKHLKILFFYKELTRHKIDMDECLRFMTYHFSISEYYIIHIIKSYKETDFADTQLIHSDLDLILIDAFANKLFKEARKERKASNQIALF